MKNSARGRFILIMFAVLVVFLAVFYFVANGKRDDSMTKLSATEATIQRDLSINYPQTPKAVVRYYAELSQCMYDPSNTDKEIEEIAKQSRALFDDELKAQQTDEQYLASLKSTVAGFIKDNRRIVSFTVSPSSEVIYSKLDIGEVASLYCTYTMQKGSVSYSDPEHFLLRRDGDGRWKILGWQSTSVEQQQPSPQQQTASPKKEAADVPAGNKADDAAAGYKSAEGTPAPAGEAEGAETPEVVIEKPTVEIPTVEIKVPGVDQ